MINQINLQDLTAEITWLGYKEKETLPFKFIKINEALKKD